MCPLNAMIENRDFNLARRGTRRVVVYTCGFPCTPFSTLHIGTRLLEDPNSQQMLRCIKQSAVTQMNGLSKRAGIKPSNFMLDELLNVYFIDFGTVTLEGGLPPMSCQLYAPPDQIVALSWDVFSRVT